MNKYISNDNKNNDTIIIKNLIIIIMTITTIIIIILTTITIKDVQQNMNLGKAKTTFSHDFRIQTLVPCVRDTCNG